LLKEAGVDLVWTPTAEIVYPADFQSWITVEEVARALEGAHRPGHFRGVATVVAKLFNAFQPDRAYFGQKDAQQAAVIRQMARDLNFPVEVVICPTVREHDGLAMSSRNAYLHGQQRPAAAVLFRALSTAAAVYAAGERDAEALRQLMAEIIDSEPLARRQYVSVADPISLHELQGPIQRALLSMAVYIGKTRLIDNLILGDI
jgi:pantoate--beta-alanine ligase